MQSTGRLFSLMMAVITNRDIAAARRINQMLSENTSTRSPSGSEFRPLEIHRYRPDEDLGGMLGLLDFSPENVKRLIALGESDACNHSCSSAECVRLN